MAGVGEKHGQPHQDGDPEQPGVDQEMRRSTLTIRATRSGQWMTMKVVLNSTKAGTGAPAVG